MAKPSATWKAEERWWAERYGGQRVPVTGRQRGSAPDVEHPVYAWEIKYGASNVPKRLLNAMDQAQASADQDKSGYFKMPVVGITKPGSSGVKKERFVFLKEENFRMMALMLGHITELKDADDESV